MAHPPTGRRRARGIAATETWPQRAFPPALRSAGARWSAHTPDASSWSSTGLPAAAGRSARRGSAQRIPDTANGLDQLGAGFLQLVAQVVNVGVEDIARRFSAFRPDVEAELLAGEHAIRVTRQVDEQGELAWGEGDLLVGAIDCVL